MAGVRHERRKRSPRHRSGERKSSSRDRYRTHRSHSDGSRRRDDDRSRRPSPRTNDRRRRSPSNQKPAMPPLFGRGRKSTRDEHKGLSFSLKRNTSRSTSRGTSRSVSRDRIPAYLMKPHGLEWNAFPKKSPFTRNRESIGFAIPQETPVSSSRLDGQLYLCLASVVALASSVSATTSSLRTGSEVASLTIQGISFSFSLITGIGLRYDPSRERLTKPLFRVGTPLSHVSLETIMNVLQLVLWCIASAISFGPSRLANDTPSSIWNVNLFYSTLAGLGISAYLVSDGCTAETSAVYLSQGHNFKPVALQRSWVLVMIAQIALVAFCLQGLSFCGENCSQFTLGAALGAVGALIAVGRVVLSIFQSTRRIRHQGFKKFSLADIVCCAVNFLMASVNAALLSGSKDESSINVYFSCWISFFLSLNQSLRYVDATLSPGSVMNDVEYDSWVKANTVQQEPKKSSRSLMRRKSTDSTKSSISSAFVARAQDAAQAEAHLESMVASRESSEPILYLDNKTGASPLSMDEEFGSHHFQALHRPLTGLNQRKGDDPSVFVPQTGIDPQPSVSSVSQQKSVRALMPPSERSRGPSIDPQESIGGTISTPSTQPPPQQRRRQQQMRHTVTRAPEPPPMQREPNMEPRKTKPHLEPAVTKFPQATTDRDEYIVTEYRRQPAKRRASVARSAMAESVSTASDFGMPTHQGGNGRQSMMAQQHERVKSMTGFVTQRQSMAVPTKMSPSGSKSRTAKTAKNSSMLSLFEEGFIDDGMAAMAQVENERASSEESSPNTLDPPPKLDPSLSSKLRSQSPGIARASPSIKSIRTNKSKQSICTSKGSKSLSRAQSYPSKARSGPSPGKSRASSRARSSTTHGSRGPPTLSEDGTGSRTTNEGSNPLTISDNDEDLVYNADTHESPSQYGPVRDISTDNLSIVSDPTMDGFDQSQRFDQSSRDVFTRMNTTGTIDGDDHVSHTGTVDQMVMMALRQAYESRQQSLRHVGGDDRSRDTRSSAQYIPRRATSDDTVERPVRTESFRHSSSERILTKPGQKTKKKTSNSGVTGSSGKSIRSFYSNNESNGDDDSAFAC
ncbi:hypothetical protein ACHAXN_008371 [Cyclotella atomus]